MTAAVRIVNLRDRPALASCCAAWDFALWGQQAGYDAAAADYQQALYQTADGVPQTWLALAGERPVGMVSLIASDHPKLPHYTPWLASLYVEPDYRRQGMASRLTKTAIRYARDQLGHAVIYGLSRVLNTRKRHVRVVAEVPDPWGRPGQQCTVFAITVAERPGDKAS